MSFKELAIAVRGLAKSYAISRSTIRHTTLVEALSQSIRRSLSKSTVETFWALNDIDFDVRRGEIVGIIGRNGAGKSTLLKILSRITKPTRGEVNLYGRVGSLLEVGTGFHQELTGRENIYLNGAILGLTRTEIKAKFDAVVAFAEVEQFLDTPVKRYSSGMYVRLAFAVAAHLEPEILIIDEVLAVGDTAFQAKCLARMSEVARNGRTVLFVSHNMTAVRQLCTNAILLNGGRIITAGSVNDCLEKYIATSRTGARRIVDRAVYGKDGALLLSNVTVNGSSLDEITLRSEERSIAISVEGIAQMSLKCDIEVRIVDTYESPIAFFSAAFDRGCCEKIQPGSFSITRTILLPRLNRGIFYLHVALAEPNVYEWVSIRHGIRISCEGASTATGQVFDYHQGAGWILLEESQSK